MTRSFAVAKFRQLLLAGSFTVLASYVVRLSDSIIAGKFLGESAFAGVNLAGPLLSMISFVGGLVATGMATNYSQALGRCELKRARQFFMQGFWSVLIFGGVFAAVMLLGHRGIIAYFGADAAATAAANAYLSWIWPVAIIDCLVMLVVSLGYADGDSKICSLGYTVIFVGNFVASILAVKLGMGVAGCALGSVIAESLGLLTLGMHFFRKSNSFKWLWHFSLCDTWRIIRSSFGDAAAFLCDGLLFFFLNRYAIAHFGPEVLPVVALITSLWGFLEVFNGIGVALQPVVTVYFGERNFQPIRTVLKSAIGVAVVEGFVLALICAVAPGPLVAFVGITNPNLVRESMAAIQALGWGFIALALAGLFNSYYMYVERPLLAGLVTFLCYLVMPIAGVAVGALYGLNGFFLGLAAGPVMGVVTVALVILAIDGPRCFPSLLPAVGEEAVKVFHLELTPAEIVSTSRAVAAVPGVPMAASLLVEEVFMVVRERARGRRLLGEVTLDLRSGVEMTLRDDGEIFDITDADQQISSLRTFLVASMMSAKMGKLNLVTTGFNRNVFRF